MNNEKVAEVIYHCSQLSYKDHKYYGITSTNSNYFSFDLIGEQAATTVIDVNWKNPIGKMIFDTDLSLDDFKDSSGDIEVTPQFIGFVQCQFPNGVISCIPDLKDVLDTHWNRNLKEVACFGAEIVLALKLGARVHCSYGYFINPLVKKGIESKTMKLAFQGCFDLYEKLSNHDTDEEDYQELNYFSELLVRECLHQCAKVDGIFNLFLRMHSYAISRVLLQAVHNDCIRLGYEVYEINNLGIKTNMPWEEFQKLEFYGLKDLIHIHDATEYLKFISLLK